MTGSRSTDSDAQIGKINADALKGREYSQNQGHQPKAPKKTASAGDTNTGRPGSHAEDVNKTGHRLTEQKDRPPTPPNGGNDRKLPG